MKLLVIIIAFISISNNSLAQDNRELTDTTSLSEVIIRGYESQRSLLATPAAVAVIGRRDMERYATVSLVPAMNNIPGVRMEERSPGSYRLSIRGSLLRSPFGVRNVKVYWNDIPFTDAGGNSYFNLIDQSSVQQVEVLKGPGGSLYGANTGGVILMHTDEAPTGGTGSGHGGMVQVTGGSYGTIDENAKWKFRSKNITSSVTQSHLQSDGYRENTRLRRDVVQWNGTAQTSSKNRLNWIALYADMYYQTPGGLTLQQMEANPRQARPAAGAIGGAKEQQAAIYNKTILTGISNNYTINEHWSNVTSLMFSYTDFKNPFILNYETRAETNTGLRSKMVYQNNWGIHHIKIAGGAEWLYNSSRINNYGNRKGIRDTLQYKDVLSASQVFPFVHAEWLLGDKLQLQAGASTNIFDYRYQRLTDVDNARKTKQLERQLLPRFAALYRVTSTLSVYASASKGFSPPTIAEIRPSDGNIYADLQPEHGWNYELGFKGEALQERIQFDISVYQFRLVDAIARRMGTLGEYFVNAGGTNQKGVELYTEYALIHNNRTGFISNLKIRGTLTWVDYRFTNYISGNKDYSGNRLTGVPRQVAGGGFDVNTRGGFAFSGSYLYTSKLPLTDDNAFFASAYQLVSGKLSWKQKFNAFSITLFTGIDNALNQLYSLGNDINAQGNRFYNPAAPRNYFGGLTVEL